MSICASILFQIGVKSVGPQRASIISTFEPITSILIGIAVFSESFNLKISFGVLMIFLSVVILTLFDNDNNKEILL